jgi:antirestriction protein ArdC
MAKEKGKSVYEIVSEQIINMIETSGELPWQRPWVAGESTPKNLKSKKEYNGFNVFYLSWVAQAKNWGPYWLTWKQCEAFGGKVKDGESKNYTIVTFWKFFDNRTSEQVEAGANGKSIPMLRYYRVYNADQCDGLKLPAKAPMPNVVSPVEAADAIVKGYILGPSIVHGNGGRASYSPLLDTVNMPAVESFTSVSGYYGVLFHELVHSTGHEKRLKRDIANTYGTEPYGREELIAELGAAMLCAKAGIAPNIDNSVGYLQSWLKAIKSDPKAIVTATGKADKAAKYIAGETKAESLDSDESEQAEAA